MLDEGPVVSRCWPSLCLESGPIPHVLRAWRPDPNRAFLAALPALERECRYLLFGFAHYHEIEQAQSLPALTAGTMGSNLVIVRVEGAGCLEEALPQS